MTALRWPVGSDDVVVVAVEDLAGETVELRDAVADRTDDGTGTRDTLDLGDVALPVKPVGRLCADREVDAARVEDRLVGRRQAVLDTGEALGLFELLARRIGSDDLREAACQENRQLAVAAARIPGELVLRAVLREDVDDRRGIARPILRVLLRDRREVVREVAQGYRP